MQCRTDEFEDWPVIESYTARAEPAPFRTMEFKDCYRKTPRTPKIKKQRVKNKQARKTRRKNR